MKLKKLLPLAGIAGVATIVAPSIASCSNMVTEFVWQPGDAAPKITPIEDRTYEIENDDMGMPIMDEAVTDYVSAIENDKTLLAAEFLNYWSLSESTMIKQVAIRVSDANKEQRTVSYGIDLQVDAGSRTNAKKVINFSANFKNVRLYLSANRETSKGATVCPQALYVLLAASKLNTIRPKFEESIRDLLTDDSWSIDFRFDTKNVPEVRPSISYHIDRTNVLTIISQLFIDPTQQAMIPMAFLMLSSVFESTYFSNVEWEFEE